SAGRPGVARGNARICGSSSIRTTAGSGSGWHGRGWLAVGRGGEEKGHAAFGQILRPDVSPVRLDDALSDRKAESGPPPAGRPAIELLEDLVLFTPRETRTAVRDLDRDRLSAGGGQNANRAGAGCVLHSVVEKVDEHLLDQHVVDRDERQIGRHVSVDAAAGQLLAEAAQCNAYDLLYRMPFLGQLDRPGF